MNEVSLYKRIYNWQSHIHAKNCKCKISNRYEHIQDFPTYKDSIKAWEIRNELGTIHHECLEKTTA